MDKQYCPHCSQGMMKNVHTFSKALAQIFLKAAHYYKEGQGFHLRDLYLTNCQYNNFQKLSYWSLVEKHYENGKRKGGYWHLTHYAQYVLDGKAVPKYITTFNKKIEDRSAETVILKQVYGYYEVPSIWAKRQEPKEQLQMSFI